MISCETEGRGRGWGHTFADTSTSWNPGRPRTGVLLTEHAVALADDSARPAHKDPAEIANALEAQNLAEGMRITGDWPFGDCATPPASPPRSTPVTCAKELPDF